MLKRTPLYNMHRQANAKLVDFAGWEMPLHYGSQLKEHHEVRQGVGMFDVSHMGIVDITGVDATNFLLYLLANNVSNLVDGKALYTCMLNEQGGILDDLIVYRLNHETYRLVINAGTREKDINWIKQQSSGFNLTIDEHSDLVMLAVQGPKTKEKMVDIIPPNALSNVINLKPFNFLIINDLFIAKTGYTGEDGYEIILPKAQAETLWSRLALSGVIPCGLGARDTLRLEAGLNLYGTDMDEKVTPFESNLAWTVALEPSERKFIGRKALEKQIQEGVKKQLVGLVLTGPGIIRNHQKVILTSNQEGEVTSGGYSPTLEKSIALARVPMDGGESCYVEIRNKPIEAKVVKPPFVRFGKKMITI